ncbi:3-keto-disaccharide hydrolase [Anatilimnocola floriformis]|uniref:3-keto-disaccharide hydrolase n=1 Tax=Anatilimnocola floriformis TaxID=2948575 RepID=UPI0020C36951|nr:DUF1080 domain-containing protein [Anatilimnocola floriformis]
MRLQGDIMLINFHRFAVLGFAGSLLVAAACGFAATGCSGQENTKAPPPGKVIQDQIAQAKDGATPKSTSAATKDSPALLTADELKDGWISLFDGETLFGWKPHSKADWKVHNGAIVVAGGEKGLLCTHVQFSDFELKVDFRAALGTNSGVFLRTSPVVGMEDVTTKCYELNIAPPDNPFPTGGFVGRKKGVEVPDSREWQSFHVTLVGGQAKVELNGKTVLEYTDEKPIGRGYIGLQYREGQVEFKNIKLKPLGLTPLNNGKDLAGWKDTEGSKSKFVAENGEINVKDGRGSLESEAKFGDFVLQWECISHAKELNSGIFFRCIPGEITNGYECQIHNGYKDGDRSKPKDFGTGGIYRRIAARKVMADDLVWFNQTLVADGANIECWVNGYPVTAWTDERKPNNNPREGLRVEAGTLQLQGHDPTTNLSFRNLQAVELAK